VLAIVGLAVDGFAAVAVVWLLSGAVVSITLTWLVTLVGIVAAAVAVVGFAAVAVVVLQLILPANMQLLFVPVFLQEPDFDNYRFH
jgi:hypothetical protein